MKQVAYLRAKQTTNSTKQINWFTFPRAAIRTTSLNELFDQRTRKSEIQKNKPKNSSYKILLYYNSISKNYIVNYFFKYDLKIHFFSPSH